MSRSGGLHSVLALLSSLLLLPTVPPVHAQEIGSGVEPRREYNVVDFLWSGSGSGSGEEAGVGTAWITTTVFKTRVETLLLPTPVLPELCSACGSALCPACSASDCSSTACLPSTTPSTAPPTVTSHRPNKLVPHQRYWLVTIIKVDSAVPDIHVFERKLENIYQLAFHRQQEQHLRLDGTNETLFKRSAGTTDFSEVVSVKMHHFRRRQEQGAMELIYSVTLSGSTVDAVAAANDMNYVSDKEVSAQLGFPVLTKAEPYYKTPKSLELAQEGNIWILVIVAICVSLLFLIIVVFYVISNKRKGAKDMAKDEVDSTTEVKPVLTNTTNDKDKKSTVPGAPKTGDDKGSKPTGVRPPTAMRDNVPKDSTKSSFSPKSFLSMPSVRAFPRGDPIPGPLEQMLETESGSTRSLSRHHSEVGDPGVIGPAVWNLHCHRISKIEREKERTAEWEGRTARRRFHQLLDDAFSLFPSQSSSPDPLPPPPPYSVNRLQQTDEEEAEGEGVKTVKAWEGREARPLSAGPFHKVEVEPTWMLADSTLRPSDAAAPLIQAIKQELDKFPSVPSSRI